MVVSTLGWISVGPGPISVLCGGWNELMRLAGAKSFMASFPERGDPKRWPSGRDLTLTGFLAEASFSTSTAWMPPLVTRSTSVAQRAGTYPDLTQLLTTARSRRNARATSAWLPKIETRRSAQFMERKLACQDKFDKLAFGTGSAPLQPFLRRAMTSSCDLSG